MANMDGIPARIYYKVIDANNVGLFAIVKKNGTDTEVQVYPPES